MLIRVGFHMSIAVARPTHLYTLMSIHPERAADIRWQSHTQTHPAVPKRGFVDQHGNSCTRMLAPQGEFTITHDAVIADRGALDPLAEDVEQLPPEHLPDECLRYITASRYCETDSLCSMAWRLFGAIEPGWKRVQAICDYVHQRLAFSYGYARATRTSVEAHEERVGVCRDFAHLAITFCRCLNIPARYVNGYLPDIGVDPDPSPMDYSAWFEVYLGGRWYAFDARHNRRRIGRIVVARGRDAMDVPLLRSFGPHTLKCFRVWAAEFEESALASPTADTPTGSAPSRRLGPPGRSPLDLGSGDEALRLL
ncbi:MAG: transglutaminase family protein [Mesorhizobium sp.]|nr:transglutaminase family protein [Mesorhizobium sp.]